MRSDFSVLLRRMFSLSMHQSLEPRLVLIPDVYLGVGRVCSPVIAVSVASQPGGGFVAAHAGSVWAQPQVAPATNGGAGSSGLG